MGLRILSVYLLPEWLSENKFGVIGEENKRKFEFEKWQDQVKVYKKEITRKKNPQCIFMEE